MAEPNAQQVLDAAPAEKWESEDEFEARLKRIESKVPTAAAAKCDNGGNAESGDKDLTALVAEKDKLKQLAEEARRRVTQLEEEVRKATKREAEYESMLEEKSEEIRKIQAELATLKSKQTAGVTEEELLALHQELQRERENLESDRQAMEDQFRQLELNMSRERAEIARERNEMQRSKNELKHKLELLEKTGGQDQSPLRRLREEFQAPAPPPAPRPTLPTLPAPMNLPAINRRAPEGPASRRSGLLSKFLGKQDQ
jgi:chromosome segregation ATPase